MTDLRYDEDANIARLDKLPVLCRAVFALLCALRLLPSYRRFSDRTGRGDATRLEALVEQLGHDLDRSELNDATLESAIETCSSLIPDEADGWEEETQPYAEDAAAAVAYALRARLTGSSQEAAWAGRRAYEAIDYFVSKSADRFDLQTDAEALEHPLLQAELNRQLRDLRELAASPSDELLRSLLERSQRESEEFFETKGAFRQGE